MLYKKLEITLPLLFQILLNYFYKILIIFEGKLQKDTDIEDLTVLNICFSLQ